MPKSKSDILPMLMLSTLAVALLVSTLTVSYKAWSAGNCVVSRTDNLTPQQIQDIVDILRHTPQPHTHEECLLSREQVSEAIENTPIRRKLNQRFTDI